MALVARALCALAVVFCSFAATAQTHNEFPALAYQEVAGYVKGASTPGDACATYASIFGWNKNNYDARNRLSRVEAIKGSDAVFVQYLHNALGQRVFKSDPQVLTTTGISGRFDTGFIGWIRRNFNWLLAPWHGEASPGGLAFVYDEQGSMLAAYSNGSNHSARHQIEYIWLPLEDGTSIPIGAYNGGRFYAVHTDHLGTPRLITGANSTPAWQWPYSAFGGNKPTGVLKTVTTTATTSTGSTTTSTQLKATPPVLESNLAFPGQYCDAGSALCYNWWRYFIRGRERYSQFDRTGLRGGTNGYLYANADPLRTADPNGEFGILLTPQFWTAASAVVSAGIAAMSQTPPSGGWSWIAHPDAEAEHQAYKDRAEQRPPPDLDECERLKWLLKREQDVVSAMQMWDLKWNSGGRHAEAIRQRLQGIERLKKKIEKVCGECK